MITYVQGDLLQSPAKVLVNPINTVGVMGKGLAADFKRVYPEMFAQYRTLCESGRLSAGQFYLYRTAHKWVLNFPYKRHWRDTPSLDYIEAGLQKFASIYATYGLTSVSFARLGLEDGGIDWQTQVRPVMEAYLDPLPVTVYIHHDDDPNASRSGRNVSTWLNNTPQTLTFDKVWRDLLRLVKRKTGFQTADGEPFTVTQEERARSRSLLLTHRGETAYLSESMLADLWLYVRGAGYCLPENLPGGLEACAACLVALLADLDYFGTVGLSTDGATYQTGLHYFPPVNKDAVQSVVMQRNVET